MPALLNIVEGTTGPIFFQVLENGSPLELSDFTVTLTLTDSDGVTIVTTGDVLVVNDINGVISYTPDSTDLDATYSPYKARWALTEDTGIVYYIPSSYRDEWDIIPV